VIAHSREVADRDAPLRIAVATWGRRTLGGAERYLGQILPELGRVGHEVGLWCEMDQPLDRAPIPLPPGAPVWCVEELGMAAALAALAAWKPDLIYVQITTGPEVEVALQEIAPAVLFAHGYFGTCISGQKMHAFPAPVPCGRILGPGCLVRYYPRRCGGLNPLTMARDYDRNVRRREVLPLYGAVVTNSEHMRAEYLRHGCHPSRTFALPLPVEPPRGEAARIEPIQDGVRRLLFAGRMDRLKGGRTLIAALPRLVAMGGGPVHLTLAGDGPDRAEWERRAARVVAGSEGRIGIDFVGWRDDAAMASLYAQAHLLVVPSTWPEPFGLVGPEAGGYGLPAAAFSVGGIPDWLREGVNGHLAPAHPPTPRALAVVIDRCLRDPDHYRALRAGAVREAARFRMDAHRDALIGVFANVALRPLLER
jgi:glycosyltransferase involved in cell wall biosynthesis